MPHPLRRSLISLALAVATILLGLALRLIPAGLSPFFVKYGGSVLWAIMVYLLLTALAPRKTPQAVAFIACAVAAVVELSRLWHTPDLDAFRLTLAGKLLLGRVFNPWHFVIYFVSIFAAACLDRVVTKSRTVS